MRGKCPPVRVGAAPGRTLAVGEGRQEQQDREEAVGTLSERVRALCEDVVSRLGPGDAREQAERISAKLSAPLKVTIAGGVSSGKSTLVNALLGCKIAPVDAGECTKVVTEFRWDPHERAEMRMRDGSVTTLPLTRGSLPAALPVPAPEVDRVAVGLSNAVLRDMTIVDTPGLDTVTGSEAATESYLGVTGRTGADTAAAMADADALVFLLPQLRRSDAEVLERFRALYRGSSLTAANAVGVLSRIDRLSRDGDPLAVAAPIASRMTAELGGLVSGVVPVVGLLAETAHAATFTEDDARAVAVCAAAGDALDREDMTLSADDFIAYGGVELEEARRRRLLELLDLYGLRVAMSAVDRGETGAAAILRALDAASGFGALRRLVTERFGSLADLFKAHAAVCDLQRLSYMRTDADSRRVLTGLRSPLESLELDADMQRLAVLEVLQAAASAEINLPAGLEADLEPLASGPDPLARLGVPSGSDAMSAAARKAAAWAEWGGDPRRSPADVRRATAVRSAYETIWAQVSAGGRS